MNDDRELVRARLKRYVERLPEEERKKPTLMRMSSSAILSPENQLREVERGTKMGRVIEAAEEAMLKRTREKAKEAGVI